MKLENPLPQAQAALDRMKRANDRGTGCHLTTEMIRELSLTIIGQWWDDDKPYMAGSPTDGE
ncbi:hypothetical protein [Aureimonas sp. N4]|uniref:hypothetical protein n=1 Tax=Aureimonas sp. N4 TaxID=1638165 RepID=UPI000781EA31|nr:hypothetical protein [Aureimonas sp. N4]